MEGWKNGKILTRRHGGHRGNTENKKWSVGMLEFYHIPKLLNCHTAFRRLVSFYCLLPISPTANSQLATAYCLTPHASRLLLLTAYWRLPTASLPSSSSHLMPHTSLPTANWRLPTSSLLMPHASRLTPSSAYCLLPTACY